jgi:hypothetical protein
MFLYTLFNALSLRIRKNIIPETYLPARPRACFWHIFTGRLYGHNIQRDDFHKLTQESFE